MKKKKKKSMLNWKNSLEEARSKMKMATLAKVDRRSALGHENDHCEPGGAQSISLSFEIYNNFN